MALRIIFALALLVLSGVAHAEGNCPSGYYPIGGGGASGCAPIPNVGGSDSAMNRPSGYWSSRWGAVATDERMHVTGVSAGEKSKRKAKTLAIKRCVESGGEHCEIMMVNENQCAAIVQSVDRSAMAGAATEAEARQRAMAKIPQCAASAATCEVSWSDCSRPVWTQ